MLDVSKKSAPVAVTVPEGTTAKIHTIFGNTFFETNGRLKADPPLLPQTQIGKVRKGKVFTAFVDEEGYLVWEDTRPAGPGTTLDLKHYICPSDRVYPLSMSNNQINKAIRSSRYNEATL